MSGPDLATLTQQVLWASFGVAAVFGALVQRTGFCTMGAVSDVMTMGDWTRMRQWGLAAGFAMAGFGLLAYSGAIDPARVLYASPRLIWLSAGVGGLVFGFGMVLASGCVSKTLVRIGGGNLKALVVALVLGIAAFATLKGLTAVWRTASVDRVAIELPTSASLPAWASAATGLPLPLAGLALGLALGGALMLWALAGPGFRRPLNLVAGFGVGALVLALWWVSGHLGFVAEHPQTLEEVFVATNSRRAESLSFVAPVAYTLDWLMFYSDRGKLLSIGIVTVFGVIAGSAVMSLAQGNFRWEGFGNTVDVAHHLGGAVLMGVGGVTAMGCSIGQGVSGVSTLSMGSFIAVAAMVAGAAAGIRYQMWRLERIETPAAPLPDGRPA